MFRAACLALCLAAATASADPAKPTLLAATGDTSWFVAVDDASVYWLTAALQEDQQGSSLYKTPKGSRGFPAELAKGQNGSYGLVLSGGDLYWTNSGSHLSYPRCKNCPTGPAFAADGLVMRLPAAGGKPQRIAGKQRGAMALAVDATSVYWLADGSLMKAPKKGGKAGVLARKLAVAERLAVDGGFVYVTMYSTENQDGTLKTDGALLRIPVKGGKPAVVASGLRGAQGIAFDADRIYLTDRYSVMSLPRAGGAVTVLAADQEEPTSLAVDDGFVYFTTYQGATVAKVPKTGGKPAILASGQEAAAGLALDSAHVYYSAAGGIYSLAK